jgi:hypothetical protein
LLVKVKRKIGMVSSNNAKFLVGAFIVMVIGSHSIHLYLKPKTDIAKQLTELEKRYNSLNSKERNTD